MTILVTGASGHVGSNLVRTLLDQGEAVRVLVRSKNPKSLTGLDVEQVLGDVCEPSSLDAAVKGIDLVYHLAAMISIVGDRDGRVHQTNVVGAENMGRAALRGGVRRMVHTCSVHAFNMRAHGEPVSEQTQRCIDADYKANAYDASKANGERRIRALVAEGLDAVITHPTGIIGPWDFEPSRMGQVFLDLATRKLPSLVDGGFDFVDVRDVVQATIAAAKKGRTNESYLLSGSYQRVGDLARMAQACTGVRPPRTTSPMWLARVGAPFMETAAKIMGSEPLYTAESLEALRANDDLDNQKARDELDFAPRPTAESIGDIYRWFAEQGRLPQAVASALRD